MEKMFWVYFKYILIVDILCLAIGLVINEPALFLGMVAGLTISLINNYILYLSVLKITYEYKGLMYFLSRLFFRFALYILGVLFVVYMSSKFEFKNIKLNAVMTVLSFLSFKILIYVDKYFIGRR